MRREAAVALGNIGPEARTAIPALTELLKAKEGLLRKATAAALREIQKKKRTTSKSKPSDTGVSEEYSYAFGKRYASGITIEKLTKLPSWNMQQSDSPPLPPGKAIRLANALKEKLVKEKLVMEPKDYQWSVQSTTLTRLDPVAWEGSKLLDKWWWEVLYAAQFTGGGYTGPPIELRIVVLMDGTVIVPKVSDDKD